MESLEISVYMVQIFNLRLHFKVHASLEETSKITRQCASKLNDKKATKILHIRQIAHFNFSIL